MGMFTQRKPRRFHHEYMFVDERKDKLKRIEERAKAELGKSGNAQGYRERMKGSFLASTKYARRRGQRRFGATVAINVGVVAIIILFLVAVWKILLHM